MKSDGPSPLHAARALTKIPAQATAPEFPHEEHHDGFSVDACAHTRARGDAVSEGTNRIAHAGPEPRAPYVCGSGHSRAQAQPCPDRSRLAARRTRSHADVEPRRAPGGILW